MWGSKKAAPARLHHPSLAQTSTYLIMWHIDVSVADNKKFFIFGGPAGNEANHNPGDRFGPERERHVNVVFARLGSSFI